MAAQRCFRKADCYVKQKSYKAAEEIYEKEVARLVSDERKEKMANIWGQYKLR